MTPKELRNFTLGQRWKLFIEQHGLMVRYNTLTEETHIKATADTEWLSADDQSLSSWRNLAKSEYGISHIDFYSYIQEMEMSNKFNPMTEFFEKSEWDGIERVDEFAESVCGEESPIEQGILKKWLTNCLHQWFTREQLGQPCLVLQGPQGIGKSMLIEWLSAPLVKAGCETQDIYPEPKNRAHLHMRSTNIMWEISELSAILNQNRANDLKRFLTTRVVRSRPPYSRKVRKYRPLACFIATTNKTAFLNDITGARRFLPVTLKTDIDWDRYTKLDAKQLWLELYQTYITNVCQMLVYTEEELEYIKEMRETFTEDPVYLNEITTFLESQEGFGFIETSQLRNHIRRKERNRPPHLMDRDIDKIMHSFGARKTLKKFYGDKRPTSCWTGWELPNYEF